ncbi:uncharacterized protein BJ171DRAFT_490875 [Polychytrium aggregatum]|uniref:uncharacterized protein n=1 Tax=Polychytrium aggregatum TaxID=110093 RepID=UPI0022FE883F|nr:uncharacterized protein BJ171DRAFT_541470 [Polychytrium aggregatum]XP_052970360.1 uncharacterized protein BJ171DRAFT_490875 [Polychytrium aggregatum]KAI9190717.1 hypothetical protein BJ171DRAFT_541470 [Polychytrium aggregatum]KAI9208280.1 hypothetical protein BJ171DRAFT_490875 [Polychytrium aggregatum]
MKFGKYIQSQQSEWGGPHYLNYKALKKIIPDVDESTEPHFTTLAASNPPGTALAHPDNELQALKTHFFFKLERELEKVNTFYLQKEREFKVRLRTLVEKKRILVERKGQPSQGLVDGLREAFFQFQHDLTKLQKFVEINATGFRKILKKFDKRAKSTTKELYLSRQVEIQPCFNNEVLTELSDIATANIADLDAITASASESEIATQNPLKKYPGETVVHEDLETEFSKLVLNGRTAEVQEFLEKRKSNPVLLEDTQFLSRVFLAVCADASMECSDLLLATTEVDCNLTDDISDQTSLHESASSGRLDLLKLVTTKYEGNINAKDVYGRKPLHYAAMHGHEACALFLLESGTNVDSLDHDGWTPLIHAIAGGHTKSAQILIDHDATIEAKSATSPIPLSLACEYGHKDIVALLLARGATLLPNANGLSPLHLTSREGFHEISALLIAHGADVEARDVFNGWTPVFFSASEGHLDCVRVLLEAGAKVNVKDENDWLPWTFALHRGHIKVAQLLEVQASQTEAAEPVSATQSKKMLPPGSTKMVGIGSKTPGSGFINKELTMDIEMEDIPALSLPPPIIPFRIYGHNYLDKKYHLRIHFKSFLSKGSGGSPINLFGSRQLSSLRMMITSKPECSIPYSVILPLKDETENYSFMVDDLSSFSLQFDIFPTFGTKVVGRAVALPSQLELAMRQSVHNGSEYQKCICPLFDTHLRVVGELAFEFAVVGAFSHPSLQIGGKVETYWKSTKVVNNTKSESGIQSFITASSLAEEYVQLTVQITKDLIPVVYPTWFLPSPSEDYLLAISNVTYAKAQRIFRQFSGTSAAAAATAGEGSSKPASPLDTPGLEKLSSTNLAKLVHSDVLTLEHVLQKLPPSIGVSINVKYPTISEIQRYHVTELLDVNTFVDNVLQKVYDHANQRSIIFSSFNPAVCTSLNWKQPNYGVFFATRCGYRDDSSVSAVGGVTDQQQLASNVDEEEEDEMDIRCLSIKQAVKFAKSSNFLGVICEARPLVQIPILINTIKESGLILATFGSCNKSLDNVRQQEKNKVDAIIVDNVFRYNVTA